MPDPVTPFPHFISETLTIFRDVLEHDLIEQNGDWIQVACERIRTDTQCLKRNRAAASKGSTTSGRVPGSPPSASCAACVRARLVSGIPGTLELSQLAKSAMKSSSAKRRIFQCASFLSV